MGYTGKDLVRNLQNFENLCNIINIPLTKKIDIRGENPMLPLLIRLFLENAPEEFKLRNNDLFNVV